MLSKNKKDKNSFHIFISWLPKLEKKQFKDLSPIESYLINEFLIAHTWKA